VVIPLEVVFRANSITYQRARRGSQRGVPLPCFDLEASGRVLRYYPATSVQLDEVGAVWSSTSSYRWFLIQDDTTGRELPLKTSHPADAHLVAEHYAAAIVHADPKHRLDPLDPVAVSAWSLQIAARWPDRVRAIPEWLVSEQQAAQQRAAAEASTVWHTFRGLTQPLDQQGRNPRTDGGHTA
jgi:hypothetical protein